MEEIIQEKISADHLLYVSLKYTKTCDVIMNLLLRWRKMIETSINELLQHAKEKKKLKDAVSENTVGKLVQIRKIFKKDSNFQDAMEFYEMLRKLENLRTERIGEFRKNVCLKISYKGELVEVNLEQLKIYAEMLEKFISVTKQFLLS